MSEDTAAAPSVSQTGNVFAATWASTPEWRKVIRIDSNGSGGFSSEVVSDSRVLKAVDAALAELADADDTPEQQQLLMSAWQALAMYLASCDDEDKEGAMTCLKMVSNLMSDNEDGPLPESTFGATMQTAATENSCPKCKRNFASQQGLVNHLAKMHAAREKKPYSKTAGPNQDQD